jgi:predicted double-glycine peptidase
MQTRTGFRLLAVSACLGLPTSAAIAELSPIRSLLEIRRQNVVVQEWDTSCGAAALATVLTHQLGHAVTEKEVAVAMLRATNPDRVRQRGGFSLLEMKRYVETRGLKATGYGDVTMGQLLRIAPAIVPVRLEGVDHFVIFRGAARGRAVLADPSFGNRTVPLEQFKEAWVKQIAFTVTQPRDGTMRVANRLEPRRLDLVEEEAVRAAALEPDPKALPDWSLARFPFNEGMDITDPFLAADAMIPVGSLGEFGSRSMAQIATSASPTLPAGAVSSVTAIGIGQPFNIPGTAPATSSLSLTPVAATFGAGSAPATASIPSPADLSAGVGSPASVAASAGGTTTNVSVSTSAPTVTAAQATLGGGGGSTASQVSVSTPIGAGSATTRLSARTPTTPDVSTSIGAGTPVASTATQTSVRGSSATPQASASSSTGTPLGTATAQVTANQTSVTPNVSAATTTRTSIASSSTQTSLRTSSTPQLSASGTSSSSTVLSATTPTIAVQTSTMPDQTAATTTRAPVASTSTPIPTASPPTSVLRR